MTPLLNWIAETTKPEIDVWLCHRPGQVSVGGTQEVFSTYCVYVSACGYCCLLKQILRIPPGQRVR